MRIDLEKLEEWSPPLPFMTARGVHNYMSTPRIYGLLRALCELTGGSYLEVGSYRGMGLVACAEVAIEATGVDNFSGVGYRQENEEILREAISGKENITFIKADYRTALRDLIEKRQKFSVIFIDGPHEIGETYAQLQLANDLIAADGFIVVDDLNELSVYTDTKLFLAHDGFKLIFEKVHKGRTHGQWWNGIAILQKKSKPKRKMKKKGDARRVITARRKQSENEE